MNRFQEKLLKTYGGGDYAFLLDKDECIRAGAPTPDRDDRSRDKWIDSNAGDTLFLFLYRELSADGDTGRDEYIRRMFAAVREIKALISEVGKM